MTALELRVLGPVTASAGGADLPLRKPRLRELLAMLVAAHGRTVSTTTLVEDLWDGAAPEGAVGAVRTFVGELRRALEPDRPPRTPSRLLVTTPTGYALHLPDDAVDVWRVEAAAAAARDADPTTVVPLLTDALAQWRGEAYEELADRPWAHPERVRVAALRADLVERLADALLTTGRPAETVTLLDPHVTAHPWREDGWRLLATALHRAHRPADALDVLRRGRRTFAEDLGLDPGPALVALEQQILDRRDDEPVATTLDSRAVDGSTSGGTAPGRSGSGASAPGRSASRTSAPARSASGEPVPDAPAPDASSHDLALSALARRGAPHEAP